MNIDLLLKTLQERDVSVALDGDSLVIKAPKGAVTTELQQLLRECKAQLIEHIQGLGMGAIGSARDTATVAPNLIPSGCERITPDMLTLVELSQADIDAVVAAAPGGVGNIQDIYALAPLQEGMLFHHMMADDGDPYLSVVSLAFANRTLLDDYLAAIQSVVERHDILRTGFVWKGIATPVQFVLRAARLSMTELSLSTSDGDVLSQLSERFDPRHHRIDLARPPLLSFAVAFDAAHDRWLLIQRLHHLIGDHSTLEIMNAEARAFLSDSAHLLDAPQPFRHFVARARHGVSESEHEVFFRSTLGDIDSSTLPFGIGDVYRGGHHVSETTLMLPDSLNLRVRAQARRLGVSVASMCHLAWGLVVARTSDRSDVVFGTVLFGRMQAGVGVDTAMGLFINTLPLRLSLGQADVRTGVQRTHEALAQLLIHEHAPLSLAQRCSGVAALSPLFSSLINYRHNAAMPEDSVGSPDNDSGIQVLGGQERTNYPLVISVEDSGNALGITAQVVAPLSPERICGYVRQSLASLVDALERAPTTALHELTILPPAERQQLLETFNATAAQYPRETSVHALFEEQVRLTPDAIALIDGTQSLSYADLNAQANRLAHQLIAHGVHAGSLVATALERSTALVVAQLAILKAGAAYVPIDPALPAARQAWMLDDAGVTWLLAPAGHVAPTSVQVLDIPSLLTGQTRSDNPSIHSAADAVAYVMYTSGSTGLPKGVLVPHRAINRLVRNNGYAAIGPDDRVAFAANPAFDAATLEVWAPLLNGGTLVVIDAATLLATPLFIDTLLQSAVNTLWLTVALFNQLAEALTPVLPQLKTLIVGGDALDPAIMARVLQGPRPQRLLNGYGPTETTTFATTYTLEGHPREAHGIPIGRPIGNARIYLLDTQGQPVPLGAVGEIYIGGDGVALGYLHRPQLTAERFLPDPFVQVADARMYRTGDLGRYLPDGHLVFLGRNDQQVKIRGYRIEPGEIEARLAEHPAVREVAVLVRQDGGSDKRLVAYVVTQGEFADLALDLRAHLATRLPDYMIPAAYVGMIAFPLTANGKLDRRALPDPGATALAQREYVAPKGEIETTLAGIWQELLSVPRVGRNDHFFDLGGHSLLAIRLLGSISQAFGIDLALAALFSHPTLSGLADQVLLTRQSTRRSVDAPIEPVPRDDALPLSFAQQRLWFLSQLEGVSATYHIPVALRLRGALNVDALRRSLDRLLERHEGLRTTFPVVDGEPSVVLLPVGAGMPWQYIDLSSHHDAELAMHRLAADEAACPFDLAHDALIRACVVRMPGNEHVLLLTQHHIVSDGWSMGILLNELTSLYRAFVGEQDDPLPPLAIQYPDYAAWQTRWLKGERLDAQRAFWQSWLADAPTLLTLPTDRPRPARQDFSAARLPLQLSPALTQGLRRIARQHGATLFMVVLTAWSTVLSRLSGQTDLIIGCPTANRGRREIEPLIGFFVNTLPMRIDLAGSPPVVELLQRIRQGALDAQVNQDLPFEQIVDIVNPPRRLDHTPLFQVLFTWQSNDRGTLDLPGLHVEAIAPALSHAKYDIELYLGEDEANIAGEFNYAAALFDQPMMERHRDYLLRALEAMVTDIAQPFDRIDLCDESERKQLLETFNATAAQYPRETSVHALFEAQVRLTPDAIALIDGMQSLSYADLNAQANRLAHQLIAHGVHAGSLVATALERSTALVVAQLAILKAGAAYVPIDPALPAARQAWMLDDAGVTWLLAPAGHVAPTSVQVLDIPSLLTGQTRSDNPSIHSAADAVAYVMYTSGSTGLPKGVLVPHRAINRLVRNNGYAAIGPDDRVAFAANPAFDAATLEVWAPLLNGGTLVVIDAATLLATPLFIDTLLQSAVNTLWLTVALFNQLAEALTPVLPQLKTLIVGGDALDPAIMARVLQGPRPQRLLNGYGPTETTTFATTYTLEGHPREAHGIPIGRPIGNARIYLLDAQGQPVPLGAVGEIYIGGDGVALGYLHRPQLTAERFLPDPFVQVADARMYRTGDLGRYLPDGHLVFLGRNDQQVKIRGYRIEPGEIEARLAEHPAVREVAVLVRQDGSSDKRLVAYVVTQGEFADLALELRAHLATRLPDYMIPAAYVGMTAFPLTANGKLDRRALPDPEYTTSAYRPPVSKEEIALAAMFCELFEREHIGIDDGFFDLGGHSLLAMRLLGRIRSVLGLELPVSTLFEAPTIAQLAQRLSSARPSTRKPLRPMRSQ
ncbi:non-ribosomal peptide synthetase [Dyella sp. GSA-30]|uniref:non-ribosomal peptide synthetase n=1 Tax=Dyella sp. GSA-30 TaxID=2994496 RepID=UPI00248FFB64|nr:non-ribosomal peptide synthetase [Dyella sp. GSA-30]BDU21543.1 hypothetical protein DYGSA30_30000 [Dyella sp. GSA-30]